MEAPLVYAPLEELGPPAPPPPAAHGRAAAAAPAPPRMVRLREAEVGQTPEGRSLGMPTRPAWRGVARSAEQLQALEEAAFAAWRGGLEARFGARGEGRLSFYETRLEFWRQLWRTLEMSDVVVVIVDARSPLLHFPEALYAHAGRDLGLPILLLLNKADLVPPAAAAAWAAWFEGRHPGLRALPVAAARGAAAETQRAVLGALLGMRVRRRGAEVQVADVVGLGLDDLIRESLRRNTHAKRHALPAAAPRSPQPPGAARAAGGGSSDEEEEEEEEGVGAGWNVKGTKAAKKDAQRRKRRKGRAGGGEGPAAAEADVGGRRGGRNSGGGGSGGGNGGGGAEEGEGDAGSKEGGGGGEEGDEGAEGRESDLEEDMELLTIEGQLRALSAASMGAAAAAGAPAAAAGGGGGAGSGCAAVAAAPVVVGLVGEPNVGKSSTLNALLGSHRVAVSSHPGRTKHYQTHYVSRRLVLCDCPGLVFPRLDVSLPMQARRVRARMPGGGMYMKHKCRSERLGHAVFVAAEFVMLAEPQPFPVLFGSFPIAHCRDPYSVLRYLAEHIWPRLQDALALKLPRPEGGGSDGGPEPHSGGGEWTPLALCEALAGRHNWRSRRGGRPDVYRAANWLLRGALAGRPGLVLAFLPPAAGAPGGAAPAARAEAGGGGGGAE
ncbi:MAG: hypothetical protein J3K34DRAFT_458942 [Monoraphidium minutum]|nr:MAG: hypothetical protein J3K34DRAFT_458942 [Monoraphidium minutum]